MVGLIFPAALEEGRLLVEKSIISPAAADKIVSNNTRCSAGACCVDEVLADA
jgi:hypothetical protein